MNPIIVPVREYGDQGIAPVDYDDCPRYMRRGAKFHCISSDGEDKCEFYSKDEICKECGCLKVFCTG